MKTNFLPAAATFDQSIADCQWLTSIPSSVAEVPPGVGVGVAVGLGVGVGVGLGVGVVVGLGVGVAVGGGATVGAVDPNNAAAAATDDTPNCAVTPAPLTAGRRDEDE